MISINRLHEVLHYNKSTGVFTRRKTGKVVDTMRSLYYKGTRIDGKMYGLHNLAFLFMEGELVIGVDHEDHDRFNNSWNNLRRANASVNNKNVCIRKDNKSGCVGVSWASRQNKWSCAIQVDGVKKHLGFHKSYDTAVTIRKAAEGWYGFHKNHGRSICLIVQ